MEGQPDRDPNDPRVQFAQLLDGAYLAYRSREIRKGRRAPSQTEFATKILGVTQTSYSNWVGGVRPPDEENLDRVATALGPELGPRVYEIFGKPPRLPRDPAMLAIYKSWGRLSKAQRQQLAETARNMSDENTEDESKGGFERLYNTSGA